MNFNTEAAHVVNVSLVLLHHLISMSSVPPLCCGGNVINISWVGWGGGGWGSNFVNKKFKHL